MEKSNLPTYVAYTKHHKNKIKVKINIKIKQSANMSSSSSSSSSSSPPDSMTTSAVAPPPPVDRSAIHGNSAIVVSGLDAADDEETSRVKLARSLELARDFYVGAPPTPVGFVPFSQQRPVQLNEKTFEVAPGLFVGSCYGASDVGLLRSLGTTHVINVTTGFGLEPNFGEAFFTYTHFPIMDKIGEDVNRILDAMRFTADLYARMRAEGGCLFVHCSAGLCRSASLVVAALMRVNHESFGTAVEQFRSKRGRPVVFSPSFLSALVKFEREEAINAGHLPPKVPTLAYFLDAAVEDISEEAGEKHSLCLGPRAELMRIIEDEHNFDVAAAINAIFAVKFGH